MIIGVTGHRKIGGEVGVRNNEYIKVEEAAEKLILELKPESILTGMALGFDSLIADLCIKLNIKFIGCVPFRGQESSWPKEAQKKYFNLLEKAEKTIIICEGGYESWKFQQRNEYIVDNSDYLITYCTENKGGTHNCIQYAKKQNKQIKYINGS